MSLSHCHEEYSVRTKSWYRLHTIDLVDKESLSALVDVISSLANALSLYSQHAAVSYLFVYSLEQEGSHYSLFESALDWRSQWCSLPNISCLLYCSSV